MKKLKFIVVGGPTASGKTKIAVELAKRFNGELINADSRQIYRFLDIGTNKGELLPSKNKSDTLWSIEGVPIHLVNIINPDQSFNVFEYRKLALATLMEVNSRGKLPILVGGTGLYIDSILKNYQLEESSVQDRKELEKLSVEDLQKLANEVNHDIFQTLNNSDRNNPRRLIRLIEKGRGPNASTPRENDSFDLDYKFLYPKYNWEELKEKIDSRVEVMFSGGKNIIEETKRVIEQGFKKEDPGLQIMGYKQVIQFLEGDITLEQCKELIKIAHRQYAKRQRTWFEGSGREYQLNIVSPNDKIDTLFK